MPSAYKYKVIADGGNHVVQTVSSGDLSTPLGIRRFLPKGLLAQVQGGAVNLIDVIDEKRIFIGLDHADIIDASNAVYGASLSDTITALNNFFATTPIELENLNDIPSPTVGRFLKYNADGYAWETLSLNLPPSVVELDDLSDVSISSPQADQALVYSGAEWVNDDLFRGKITTTSTDITFTTTGKINLDGTIRFKRFSSPPTAFEGGMYADDQDDLYFGVE